jgi:preprotein translocase subunit SecG
MNSLFAIVIVVQVVSALVIIGLVLLQHGKGADMGAAFGSGASGSLFGASGSSNFLSRSTGLAAAVFFVATLALSFISSRPGGAVSGVGVMEQAPVPAAKTDAAPAAPAAPAAAGAPAGKVSEIPK